MGTIGNIAKAAIGIGFGVAALHILSHGAREIEKLNKRKRKKSTSGFYGI